MWVCQGLGAFFSMNDGQKSPKNWWVSFQGGLIQGFYFEVCSNPQSRKILDNIITSSPLTTFFGLSQEKVKALRICF